MRASKQLKNFQKEMEGYKHHAYRDSVGVLTIGIGHTSQEKFPFTEESVWTDAQIEEAWRSDIQHAEALANRYLGDYEVSQAWFDALTDLIFNTGKKPTTLLRYLTSGNEPAAREQLLRWVYAGGRVELGLVRRRLGNYIMTLEGDMERFYATPLATGHLVKFNKLFKEFGYEVVPNDQPSKFDIVEI